jgi:hypothetical protein
MENTDYMSDTAACITWLIWGRKRTQPYPQQWPVTLTYNGWGQVSVLAWCFTSVEISGLPWLNTVPPTPGTEVNFCCWAVQCHTRVIPALIPNPRPSNTWRNTWRKFVTNTNTKQTLKLDITQCIVQASPDILLPDCSSIYTFLSTVTSVQLVNWWKTLDIWGTLKHYLVYLGRNLTRPKQRPVTFSAKAGLTFAASRMFLDRLTSIWWKVGQSSGLTSPWDNK